MICWLRRWRDLDSWIPDGQNASSSSTYPSVPLGDVLTERREAVKLSGDLQDWSAITIHFDGSIEPRDRRAAFKGSMYAAYPGDLFFSKIDIRNGAIALIPQNLPKVVVTSEYPVHIPDLEQVDPRYLALLLRTPEFLSNLKKAASGTSGRKRITPERFRSIQVPLPLLADQRLLVDTYSSATQQALNLESEAGHVERRAVQEFEAALGISPPPNLPVRRFQIAHFRDAERWTHEGILQRTLCGGAPPESKFEIVFLEEIAEVSYGIQKCPTNRPGSHARPYLRVANVQRGRLDLLEIKHIDVPDSQMPTYRLAPGDILFVEGNGSRKELGRVAVWNDEIADCVHQNHLIKARLDKTEADPDFIAEWFNTDAGRAHFFRNAKTTSGLGTINSNEVKSAPVPLPPRLDVQVQIVRRLRTRRSEVAKLRERASAQRLRAWQEFGSSISI